MWKNKFFFVRDKRGDKFKKSKFEMEKILKNIPISNFNFFNLFRTKKNFFFQKIRLNDFGIKNRSLWLSFFEQYYTLYTRSHVWHMVWHIHLLVGFIYSNVNKQNVRVLLKIFPIIFFLFWLNEKKTVFHVNAVIDSPTGHFDDGYKSS